jgi:hypothetical protein
MPLFQNAVVIKYCNNLNKNILAEKWLVYKNYFLNPDIQNNIRNSKEEQYQGEFLIDLFVNVLGYTKNPTPDFNLTTELKNEKDGKKADGGIMVDNKVVGVIELKGTNTTDLNKIETQAFGYKNNQRDCVYVITSNFEKLRFYIDNAIEHIEFNLFQMTEKDFEKLYLCLAYENISQNLPKKIKEESVNQENQITKSLYKDYSLFKNELFHNLVSLNPQFEALDLFKKSQKLIDRFLFLFFAEDRQLLPPNSVRLILDDWRDLQDRDVQIPLYDRYKKYFEYLNTGYKGKRYDVFAYNGGLFKLDAILDQIKIDDELLYKHTIKLAAYDFASEVDVNILGHIFENSLNELDEMKAQLEGAEIDKSKTKRKKDGVFYTPKYITKYIVENTVGKLCTEKKEEFKIVEEEFIADKKRNKATKQNLLDKLTHYRNWLLQITICDPACGSGAFLNEALNFLIAEHSFIDELQAKLFGDALILSDVEKSILENNLFGVDLNEESVEIAKLSLWLRTAQPNRKLNDLNNNIKCGNSLIDDVAIAGEKAFVWENEFPKIFAKDGFDVVIGNPPYVSVKMLPKKDKDFYADIYTTAKGQFDLYILFYEKGFNLIKENGILSFITSNTFISNQDYSEFRKYILSNSTVLEILNLGETVFEDANLDVAILSFEKSITNTKIKTCKNRNEFDERNFSFIENVIFINDNYEMKINISMNDFKLLKKLNHKKNVLSNILELPRGIEFGSNSEKIFKEQNYNSHKIIFGKSIDRYNIDFENHFCFFEDNKSIFKSLSIYENEKILIQRIRNLSLKRRIVATYDDEKYLCTNTLRIGYLKSENYNLKFILALLNSNVINFIFLKQFLNKDIYSFQLQQIPIPNIKLNEQLKFSVKVDLIISKIKETKLQSQKFQRTIQRKFELDVLPKKLQDWYLLSYADFVKELAKKKIKLSLSQEAEWEDYFTQEANKALQIKNQIDTTDAEIDQMVYELYGLSEEEITIVENS